MTVGIGGGKAVIAGCSRRKLATASPVPALELYQGGCVPQLRKRVGIHADLRRSVYILSAKHGLVGADEPLLPYELPLTIELATELRSKVWQQLQWEFRMLGRSPSEMLLVLEPLYLVPLADLLAMPDRPRLHWIHDGTDWGAAAAVLDEWGWPSR